MRSVCSTYGGAVTGVRVNDDSFIVVTATVPGDDVADVTIAVGPDRTVRVSGEHRPWPSRIRRADARPGSPSNWSTAPRSASTAA